MACATAELILVVPPAWETSFQSLGVPVLAAYTRALGFAVEKLDLNIAFYQYLSGSDGIDLARVRSEWQQLSSSSYYRRQYEPRRDEAGIRIDLPFGYAHLVANNYSRLPGIFSDEKVNLPLRFYREQRLAEQLAERSPGRCRVIGMTVEGENQLVGAVTLAQLIKALDQEIVIVLGGPWITTMCSVLRHEAALLAAIDALIPHKGEIPLAALLEEVERTGGRPCRSLPGALVNRGTHFSEPLPAGAPLRLSELPRAELFELSGYTRPNVLPYESERGCYWGKCRFCHHILHYTHAYSSKPMTTVVEDLQAYDQHYDYDIVAFVDAAMPPRRISEIAEAFLEHDLGKRWACFSKIERQFTPELFATAARSGLDVISFGVETVSPRLAEFIGKPVDAEIAYQVLDACAAAGIYTTAGIINGLPSETQQDLDLLWSFLDRIRPFTYLHPKVFRFERGSEFFEHPEQYGIEVLANHPESRLSAYAELKDHHPGATREHLLETDSNHHWWRANMGKTLDWKHQGERFCKAVQCVVDT